MRPQQHRLTYPLTARQVADIDTMFETLFKAMRGVQPTVAPVDSVNPAIQGIPGQDGVDGDSGPPGLPGPRGDRGLPGFGLPGQDGDPGEDSIIPGPSGPPGVAGAAGATGATGATGAAGAAGPMGLGVPGQDAEESGDGWPSPVNLTGVLSGLTAGRATALATARTIAGVSFDGSANISLASTGLSDTANIAYLNATDTFTNSPISITNGSAELRMLAGVIGTTFQPGFFGTNTADAMTMITNNASRFIVSATGAVRWTAYGAGTLQTDASGNITAVSDERLKDVQGAFTAGLAEILNIEPILYKWKEGTGLDTVNTYAGFSAQNILAAIPCAVSQNPDGFLSLIDRVILAALCNAVRELRALIPEAAVETAQGLLKSSIPTVIPEMITYVPKDDLYVIKD